MDDASFHSEYTIISVVVELGVGWVRLVRDLVCHEASRCTESEFNYVTSDEVLEWSRRVRSFLDAFEPECSHIL